MREYLLTLLVAAGATYLLVALTGKIAYAVGAVPPTRDRDVHRAPVPRLGGLAMLGGLLCAMLVASYLPRMSERVFEQSNDAQALVSAAAVICLVGVADDIWAGFARVAVQAFDLLLLDDDVRLDRHEAMIVTDLLTFARRKHADTRGIVLSTFEEDVHRYQREDGVLAVLEKPVEVPRLRRELEGLTPYRASGPRD